MLVMGVDGFGGPPGLAGRRPSAALDLECPGGGCATRCGLLPGVMGGRDLPPGQCAKLGVGAELVVLHGQQAVGGLAGDQELGALTLGVPGIGGHHRAGQVGAAGACKIARGRAKRFRSVAG
jgi:hypothetical protein